MYRLSSLLVLSLCLMCGSFISAQDSGHAPPADDINDPPPADNRPPMLGVQFSPPSRRVLEQQGLEADQGVYVHRVYDSTAASGLGVQRGDVIVAINGRPIGSMSELREIVNGSKVGDNVDVVVRRDGKDLPLTGGSYQVWPENIPKQPIDAAAEERYREAQRARLSQDLRQADRMNDTIEDLDRQLSDLEANPPLAAALGLEPDGMLVGQDIPRLRDGSMPTTIPKALLQLPGWQFNYDMGVSQDAALIRDANKLEWDELELTTPADPAGLNYSFEISSEVF